MGRDRLGEDRVGRVELRGAGRSNDELRGGL